MSPTTTPFRSHSPTRTAGAPTRTLVHVVTIAVVTVGLLSPALALRSTTAAERDDDRALIAGLRDRRLFSLAEFHCRRTLASPALSDVARAEITIELIRTLAEQAAHAPAAEREAMWDAALEAGAAFFRSHPENPRIELVQVQDAMTSLSRGELARMEADASPNPEEATERAREALREAALRLEQLDRQLADAIPQRTRLGPRPGQLSAEELVALQNNVQLQRARALRNQGLSYPPASADRVASLTASLDQLTDPLKRLAQDDPLLWQLRLEQVQAQRLLGRVREAAELLDQFSDADPPGEFRQAAIVEAARVQVAAQRPDRAIESLAPLFRDSPQSSGDAALALFEAHLATWQAAKETGEEKETELWRNKTVALADTIRETYGPYWGRRAEIDLIRVAGGSGASSDVELLRRTADELYLKGAFDEAIAAYDRAAEVARQGNDAASAFSLAYKAALVERQREHHAEAAARFAQAAQAAPQQPEAAKAHLLAAWLIAQQVRAGQAELPEYIARLERQTELWPGAPETDQARVWLGAIREQRQEWLAAAAAFRAVSPFSEHFPAAIPAVERTTRRALAALAPPASSTGDPANHDVAREEFNRILEEAIRYFEQIARGETPVSTRAADASGASTSSGRASEDTDVAEPPGGQVSPVESKKIDDDVRRRASVAAASLALDFLPNGHARAEQALSSAPPFTLADSAFAANSDSQSNGSANDAANDAAQTAAAARVLLIVALAGQPSRQSAARQMLADLQEVPPAQRFAALVGLARIAAESRGRLRADLADMQLRVLEQLEVDRARLSPGDQSRLDGLHAEALASAGREDQAIGLFERLVERDPDNGRWQEGLGELLVASSNPERLKQALERWRVIAARSRPQSDRWWTAKYNVALAQFKTGDREGAGKLLRYLQATQGFTHEPTAAQFEDLLRRCTP